MNVLLHGKFGSDCEIKDESFRIKRALVNSDIYCI